MDILTRMLKKAVAAGLIRGLGSDLVENGVVCLQYADDTILFLDANEKVVKNMKWIFTCFEQMSGMRINYHKSEIIPMNVSEQEKRGMVETLGCPEGTFPINYLGIPLHYQKLTREDLQPLVDKILKRISGWRGKLLSHAGRIVLIKTCLASIPIYLMSFFKFPKWALKLINTHMANCLWNDYEGHGRIHLANWQLVSMKKEAGGLGIPDLRDLNLALLGSWVKRFIRDEGKLWHSVIRKKYMRNAPNIFCVPTTHSSTFWKGVIGNAKALKFGYKWSVGDGMQIRFWEDTWFGNSPCLFNFGTYMLSVIKWEVGWLIFGMANRLS